MEQKIAFIGIIIESLNARAPVNSLLQEAAGKVLCQTGLPYDNNNKYIISVILDATDNEVKSLADKLGRISGVSVISTPPVNYVKIILDKYEYEPEEEMSMVLIGATPITDTVRIYKHDAPTNSNNYFWGSSVPANFYLETQVPQDAGHYEVRLHSAGSSSSATNPITTTPFVVLDHNTGDVKITLNKSNYDPGERMQITLKGAMPLSNSIYICRQRAPYSEKSIMWGCIVPLNNPIFTFAPKEEGRYEVRLHSVVRGIAEANLMYRVPFTV